MPLTPIKGGADVPVKDGTLVLGVLNGDRSAFAELYDRRARLIRASCYDQTRDLQTAADLTQETFLRAYKNLKRLRDPDRFPAWLVGITRQVCREWRRGKRREQRGIAGYAELRMADASWALPPDDRLLELREAVAGSAGPEGRSRPLLSERERLALHAYYLQGRSVEEARAVLGLSKSGFHRVLSSACERLRRILQRSEVRP